MASFIDRLRLLRFFMSPYEAVKMALNENKDLSFETRIENEARCEGEAERSTPVPCPDDGMA